MQDWLKSLLRIDERCTNCRNIRAEISYFREREQEAEELPVDHLLNVVLKRAASELVEIREMYKQALKSEGTEEIRQDLAREEAKMDVVLKTIINLMQKVYGVDASGVERNLQEFSESE